MSMSAMSRRDRTILAVFGVVMLYGFAAVLFLTGRQEAWERSRKAYDRAVTELAKQKKLISERAEWEERNERVSVKMPKAEEGESSQTRRDWQRTLERIAKEYNVQILSKRILEEQENSEEANATEGVGEMPIDVNYEASLVRLVEFLYAIRNVEGAMFDIRDLTITARNNGFLRGRFTLTCAYERISQ